MDIQVFALHCAKEWGSQVVNHIDNLRLAELEERDFEDGEHKIRTLESVRGRHVFVITSLYSDSHQSVNDKLCRLLFFIGSLKDASAARVTLVLPYFAYARKDRKTKSRDPVTTRYLAKIIEAAGADQIVTMDIHNLAAFQNAFTIPTEHLEASVLFAPYFVSSLKDADIVVVSPDAGGVKRADKFRETLGALLGRNLDKAFLEKRRSEGVVSGGQEVIGDVKDRIAIIIDDMIGSGTTIKLAVNALYQQGVNRVFVCATHGLFTGKANHVLSELQVDKILITDSIPPFRLSEKLLAEKVEVLDTSQLFAETISRIYQNQSVVDLLEEYPHRV